MQYETVELKETKVVGFTARTNNSSPDMGGSHRRSVAEIFRRRRI